MNSPLTAKHTQYSQDSQAIDAYYRLRTAQHYFKKLPTELTPEQNVWLQKTVARQQQIEQQVLTSEGAEKVVVSDEIMRRAMESVHAQYDDSDAFLNDLQAIGMSVSLLSDLLERQQRVELVMAMHAGEVETISVEQARHFYDSHPDKFIQPERRQAWHLLITVNPDYPENRRDKALQRINKIRKEASADISLFKALAERHSECPSALKGGELGWVARDYLYPQIDAALFALDAGQLSEMIETDIGLHLVLCSAIRPEAVLSFTAVVDQIREQLTEHERAKAQQHWLSTLA